MRIERDSMGEVAVPSEAYYGASTARALENFPVSDLRFPAVFIEALCLIKSCSARVNQELGLLEGNLADAIVAACDRIAAGEFHDQFVVDIFQTGSGTSTNMNANEVIANLAIESLGGKRGDRNLIHPNDHVNLGTSSNDVIPTAIHIAALLEIGRVLRPALIELKETLSQKAVLFMPVVKTGRTHLQDAVPIRLGQEFLGYSGQIERALLKLQYAEGLLAEVALGGTAVGTGLNTERGFSRRVLELINKRTALILTETDNHFQAQSTIDGIVAASGVMKSIAVSMLKILNDIRFLASGPRAGYGELKLPSVQPGSSIMPGKVNPVIAESTAMVCAQVVGNDAVITLAGQSGNFELNVMLPVAGYNLLQSIALLGHSPQNFSRRCVNDIEATDRGPELVSKGLSLCTALVPAIGYDQACRVSKHAESTGCSIMEAALDLTELDESKLAEILDPARMTGEGG